MELIDFALNTIRLSFKRCDLSLELIDELVVVLNISNRELHLLVNLLHFGSRSGLFKFDFTVPTDELFFEIDDVIQISLDESVELVKHHLQKIDAFEK